MGIGGRKIRARMAPTKKIITRNRARYPDDAVKSFSCFMISNLK
jgi:hypothetical protein